MSSKKLSADAQEALIAIVKARFEKHKAWHKGLDWADVQARLEASPAKLWSLQEMEQTGGEPGVVAWDKKTGEYTFFDCAPESPKGRRSLCYDNEALEERKEHKPADSAIHMAEAMGIKLLTEAEYRALQELGHFDLKTSSWIETPAAIRRHGGAVFADRRYDHVFVYHNGAVSYYAARGFRGSLKV